MRFAQVIVLASLVMFASAQCNGTWSPSAISSYVLTWIVSNDGLNVDFNVSVTTSANRWVAVGFSATPNMPNSDIAVAADDGTNSFVEDRYAIVRAIPTYDTMQSFTNTMTERIGGKLSFSFTRLINSADTNDQDVDLNVCQYVLYAWGGSVSNFTSPASFGYHPLRGVFSNQICLQQCDRVPGSTSIPSISQSPSPSSTSLTTSPSSTSLSPSPSLSTSPSPSPPSCSGTWTASSSYVLSWEVSDDGLSVEFNVSVTTATNTWVAVGFSATHNMPNSDIAIAADDGNNSFVEDRYAIARIVPSYDSTQSFTNTMTERIGSKLSFSFTRLINSADTNDQDVDLNVCQYVLYAWGGSVSSFTSPASFGYHPSRGIFSNRICLQQCDRISGRKNPCHQPSFTGPCRGGFPRYFYNTTSQKCEKFIYGGCNANDNNFFTLHDCQQQCSTCPPTCSDVFCVVRRDAICTIPTESDVDCQSDNCIITNCRACYYSNTTLPFPQLHSSCPHECENPLDEECMKEWGRCVRRSFFINNKILLQDIAPENFHCWNHKPCLSR